MPIRTEHTCTDCTETFETRDNYLARNDICSDCFEFPDMLHDETLNEVATVYFAASIDVGMHEDYHAAYFRVAAYSEADARFFVRTYQLLEGNTLVSQDHRPTVALTALPPTDPYNGYAVTKLDSRNADDDYIEQTHGDCPTTMGKLPQSV
ncbi:hypothetical protein [Natrinema sp. DC36]|uniref:hypothetical protein n=1 Tax=Natrinema sp. DC36 TaxID=2878680 RepID=UPI001CF0C36D|nr:hypothetical protein [Natrinema sp. DC36]